MFDWYGPHGAEEEREPAQTDGNGFPAEREDDDPDTTAELLPPVQEPYGPALVPPEILPDADGGTQ